MWGWLIWGDACLCQNTICVLTLRNYIQVKTCKENGIKSKTFSINMNGISTEWNLSLQFWVDGQGCRLTNPVVLCLNLVGCRVATNQDVAVKYKFGIYNQNSQEFEMGASDKVRRACWTRWTWLWCCRQVLGWRRRTSCSLWDTGILPSATSMSQVAGMSCSQLGW